jgi:FxLD family lantipeptide
MTAQLEPLDDFDLDIEFIEAGSTVEHIIKMTDDNCGTTCQSACTSC